MSNPFALYLPSIFHVTSFFSESIFSTVLLIVFVLCGHVAVAPSYCVDAPFLSRLTLFLCEVHPLASLLNFVITLIINFPVVAFVIFFTLKITLFVASSNIFSTIAPPDSPSHSYILSTYISLYVFEFIVVSGKVSVIVVYKFDVPFALNFVSIFHVTSSFSLSIESTVLSIDVLFLSIYA